MGCSSGNPAADFIKGFFSFLGDPIGTIVAGIAHAVLAAAISTFGSLTTNIPTLVTGGAAGDVDNQTHWIVVYTAVGSLIFASARMALERRAEAGTTAIRGLLRVIAVSGTATFLMTALARLSDRYADHLFAAGAQKQLSSIGCSDSGTGAIQSFLLLVLAFLLLIAAIVQTILLYVRLGVMIVLLGTLPLAAAASMTDWGSGWWRKHIGWMIAWLLYKPAAGLVIYAGSAMISQEGHSNINERIAGIGVMLLSALALPSLLKLVVPATAALGGAAAQQNATSAAVGAVASGAKSLGAGAQGAGSGAAAGASPGVGPTGARGTSGGAGSSGSAAAGRAGAAGAAAAMGPLGAVAGAAVTAAKGIGKTAAGAVDGADGNAGHNR